MASLSSQGTQGKLNKYYGFRAPGQQDYIWSEGSHFHVLWVDKLFLQVHSQLPIRGSLQGIGWVLGHHAVLMGPLTFPYKGYGFGQLASLVVGFDLLGSFHLGISVRTWLCLHLYLPSVNAFGQQVRKWFSVQETAPHWLHDESSSLP